MSTARQSGREVSIQTLSPITGRRVPSAIERRNIYGRGHTELESIHQGLYLPYVEEQKRRSTYCGYKNLWLRYIESDGEVALRDFRTIDGQQMLRSIATREDLSRSTLGHIKHFLGGVFRYARRQGVLHSPNPMYDVEIPKGRPAADTYAYSLEEEALMLTLLPEPAATVVATAASPEPAKENSAVSCGKTTMAAKYGWKSPCGAVISRSPSARKAKRQFQ